MSKAWPVYVLTCLATLGLAQLQANDNRSSPGPKRKVQPTSNARQKVESRPRTVLDYYLALPEKYVRFASETDRRSLIKTKDIKNGYLMLEGHWDGWAEIALFRKSDGGAILAIEEIGCGPICACVSIVFLQYDDGSWKDVTKHVLPKVSEKLLVSNYHYELPRVGTDLKVVIQFLKGSSIEEKTVSTLRWNGEKFELQKIK